jgi:hypothetical protein
MGNHHDTIDKYRRITFKRTNLPDVNDFCDEMKNYNEKVNKIRDALEMSEKNLILYLGLNDIETLIGKTYKISIKDVTMSLFYSFSAYFKGDFMRMLDLKFNEEPPFFVINIHYLDAMMKDIWI